MSAPPGGSAATDAVLIQSNLLPIELSRFRPSLASSFLTERIVHTERGINLRKEFFSNTILYVKGVEAESMGADEPISFLSAKLAHGRLRSAPIVLRCRNEFRVIRNSQCPIGRYGVVCFANDHPRVNSRYGLPHPVVH